MPLRILKWATISVAIVGLQTSAWANHLNHPKPMAKAASIGAKLAQATVYPGSLKDNIIRMGKQFGWQEVVWNVPNDYRWVGRVDVHAKSFDDILVQVLKDYPVQAIFYEGNHVLVIVPRTV